MEGERKQERRRRMLTYKAKGAMFRSWIGERERPTQLAPYSNCWDSEEIFTHVGARVNDSLMPMNDHVLLRTFRTYVHLIPVRTP